jgi:hypothetical protein
LILLFNLYDKVIIKSKNLPGTIVDIINIDDKTIITVESDIKGKRKDGYGGDFPLFDCSEDDLKLA